MCLVRKHHSPSVCLKLHDEKELIYFAYTLSLTPFFNSKIKKLIGIFKLLYKYAVMK